MFPSIVPTPIYLPLPLWREREVEGERDNCIYKSLTHNSPSPSLPLPLSLPLPCPLPLPLPLPPFPLPLSLPPLPPSLSLDCQGRDKFRSSSGLLVHNPCSSIPLQQVTTLQRKNIENDGVCLLSLFLSCFCPREWLMCREMCVARLSP